MEPFKQRTKLIIFVSLQLLAGQFGSLNGNPSEAEFGEVDSVNGETFDFIVVGGGTAGCVMAARLAENGNYSVLLIEAGGKPHPDLDIPALSVDIARNLNGSLTKIYPSVRHPNAALARNGVVNVIRPFTLGGGSAINGQILNRGSPHDYDRWANLTGDDSWNYSNLLKYFKKLENYSGDLPTDQRGFNGPIPVSKQAYSPGLNEWLQAGRELGFRIEDPNGPQVVSFTTLDFTRKKGRRVTSYNGYIEPMLQSRRHRMDSSNSTRQSNLRILINSQVKKIIFEGNRAVGVNFTTGNSTSTVGHALARKEIIVSAGAIESPILLMKSGLGPKSVLEASDIPPVKHLPVGRNLHDHPLTSIVVAFANRSAAVDSDKEFTPAALEQFMEFGDGPYTNYMGEGLQALLVTSAISPEERDMGWSDLQLLPLMSNVRGPNWNRDGSRDMKEGEIHIPWSVFVGRPRSRGSVTLNPENIDGIPLIDFQYFTDPYDIQVMVEGLKMCAKLCEKTAALQGVGCRIPVEDIPGCSHLEHSSDPYWECYGKHLTVFGYHAAGSCKMGRGSTDPDAVVDPQLKVIGIQGLRVVDASIMPEQTNANPMAPIYAIAEKASDMILLEWEGGVEFEAISS